MPDPHAPHSRRRVAVVAVHGVADHPPREMAHAVTDLLLRYRTPADQAVFTPAHESSLRLPVERVHVSQVHRAAGPAAGQQQLAMAAPPTAAEETADSDAFEERSPFFLRLERTAAAGQVRALAATPDELAGLADGFVHEQMQNFRLLPADAVYDTVRLETTRLGDDRQPQADVHIFEMYWADLTGLGQSALRIFGELYQLVFHLSQVGRLTLDFAVADHAARGDRGFWWNVLSRANRYAVRLLTLPIPVLNLFLLALVLLTVLGCLSPATTTWISTLALIAASVCAAGWVLLRWPISRSYWFWALAPFAVTGAVGGLMWRCRAARTDTGQYRLLAIEASIVAAFGVAWAVNCYNSRRPGANRFARWSAWFVAIALVAAIFQYDNSAYGLVSALLRLMEVVFLPLAVSWLLFLFFTCVACVAGLVAICRSHRPGRDAAAGSRTRRAIWTALACLSLPGSLYLLVTLVLYAALSKLVAAALPGDLLYVPGWTLMNRWSPINLRSSGTSPEEFFTALLAISGTTTFALFLWGLVAALLLIVWGLFPAVWAELRPSDDSERRSQMLGRWLTNGYRYLTIVAFCLLMSTPVALSVGLVLAHVWPSGNAYFQRWPTATILAGLAAAVIGTGGGLLAFNGRLDFLALGFRPALRAILDVDSYMREFPRNATPRARIFARYSSLLRYLCHWRQNDDPQRHYDAIVVVSHSQGTAISAELLRFLKNNPDPTLAALGHDGQAQGVPHIPVYLVTVGCPLRQLYGWRFPHLYDWAYHNGDSAAPFIPPDIAPDTHPNPGHIGVRRWINAYRSGDYIGRHLWRSDHCDYLWQQSPYFRSRDAADTRLEFCLGDGAHTHYFDNAPQVAAAISDLMGGLFHPAPAGPAAPSQPKKTP